MGDVLYFRSPASNTEAGPADRAEPGTQEASSRRKANMATRARSGSLVTLVDRYTKDRIDSAEASRRTAHEQRLTLLQFADSFGGRQVAKLGESDVIRWLGTTDNLQPSTRRNKLSVVKGFCRWLVKHGHVRRDPSVAVRSPRQPRTVPKVFELSAVTALLSGCPDARARLIVLLMCQMGLRCGEVAGLELGDIDGKLAIVEGKGGHQRALPLPAEVQLALTTYLADRGGHAGALIQNYKRAGLGVTAHTISQLVRQLCLDAGIKRYGHDGISAHGLRRTFASDLFAGGADLLDVAEALGHVSTNTTRKHYVRYRANRLSKIMEGRWYGRGSVGETG